VHTPAWHVPPGHGELLGTIWKTQPPTFQLSDVDERPDEARHVGPPVLCGIVPPARELPARVRCAK
jgi:hypothetical protein